MTGGEEQRAHPRLTTRTRVEVRVAGRDELQELWTRDLSKGGLFVEADDPPPLHTRLEVILETPGGTLPLTAEVVHVLEPAVAGSMGLSAGVGLQILDLVPERRALLDAYLRGVSDSLGDAAQDEAPLAAEELGALLRTFFAAFEASDLYEALALPPASSVAEIDARLAELERTFSSGAAAAATAVGARCQSALRALDRVSKLLRDPGRRLRYDLQAGHLRVDERLKDGSDPDELRRAWEEIFPERIADAARHAGEALGAVEAGQLDQAVEAGERALELDPFNRELREAVARWAIESALDDDDD